MYVCIRKWKLGLSSGRRDTKTQRNKNETMKTTSKKRKKEDKKSEHKTITKLLQRSGNFA